MLSKSEQKLKEKLDNSAKGWWIEHTNLKNLFRIINGFLGGHLALFVFENYNQMNFDDTAFHTFLSHALIIVLFIFIGEGQELVAEFVKNIKIAWMNNRNPLVTSIQKEIDREKELVDKIAGQLGNHLDEIIKAFENHLTDTQKRILEDHTEHIAMVFSQSLSHIQEAMGQLEGVPNQVFDDIDSEIKKLKDQLAQLQEKST